MTSWVPRESAGSTLNITPDWRDSTMRWTTTAMLGSIAMPWSSR